MSPLLRVRACVAALTILALFGPAAVSTAQPPRPSARALADYDSRWQQPGRTPAVAAALDRLRASTGRALAVRVHPLTGAARRVWSDRPLTPASGSAPTDIARGFLSQNADLLGLEPGDMDRLLTVREYSSWNDPMVHVIFQQVIDGIPVFEGFVGVHILRDGSVTWITSEAMPPPRGPASPRWSAEAAARVAAADVQMDVPAAPQTALTYFPARGGLRLAWQVILGADDGTSAYVVVVDATTGDRLYRRSTLIDADGTGSIFQSATTAARDPRMPEQSPRGAAPAGPDDPPGGCPPPDALVVRSLTAPFRDTATVLSDEGRLNGNNATVYRRSKGVWGALGSFASGTWTFDFPFNSADSVETSVFWALNFAHDFFYDLGFDEAAGNLQAQNFGRGGLAGDPLVAVARAAGRNNANIAVYPDGESALMNLFLWDGRGCWSEDVDGDGTPDLDGGYDTDIIVHEYHHGVSIRLNPAWSGDEAGAIGEGGSDFFAYSIYGDTRLAQFSFPPDGIRGVNAKTYADWYCLLGLICEPHDNGEIWANVLWDLRERFRLDGVNGSDGAAVRSAHQLYIDGLKLSPAAPTMLDLRDAMLQADRARHPSGDLGGSLNYCRMWDVFARRGMGLGALDTHDTLSKTVVADFVVPAGCPGPQVVTITAAPSSIGEAGATPAVLTVSRTGDSTDDLTIAYTTSGTAGSGTDYVTPPGTVTIPAGATAATMAIAPLDDTIYEPDETVVVTLDTRPDYIVGSPSSATVTIVSDDLAPDLAVSALSAPATAAAGGSVVISETTANRGQGAAGVSATKFVLSTNFSIDAGDVTLGSRAIGALAAGASSAGGTPATIPVTLAPGSYYLLAVADAELAVPESNESNNIAWVMLKVGPDLVVSSLSAPAIAGAGASIAVVDTTTNQGAAGGGPSRTRFFVSANVLLDAGDTLLSGSRPIGALAAGGSSTGTTTVALPTGLAPGQYFLLAQADGDDTVVESSESNNVKYTAVRIGADLVPTALGAPASAGAGSSIVVTDTVANQGGGDAIASTTRFYLSANSAFDSADVALDGARAVPSLAAGATSSGSTTVQIPGSAPTGRLYLLAVADADGVVSETSELNNVRYVVLTVGGDLVVSSLSGPSAAGAGSSITVTDNTANQGGNAVASSTTRYYLSTDARHSADDVALAGGRAVPALAAGASSAGPAVVTVPEGVASGPYYLIAKADADLVIDESEEANNTRYVTMTVGPDLVISSLTAPAKAGAGLTFQVTESTRNQGGGAAGASVTRYHLSLDWMLGASDVALAESRAVTALPGGELSTGTTTLTIPATIQTGAYFLIAEADGGRTVAETNEGNNTRYASVRIGPDLVVTSISAPTSAAAGSTIAATDTTMNQGGGSAAASVTRYYLSTDAFFSSGDVALGEGRMAGSLAPNGTSVGSVTLAIPADTAPGLYYLIARSDDGNVVVETFETNNTRFRSIQLMAP